jgi:cytosine/uracil/thiamine/allantoin permease
LSKALREERKSVRILVFLWRCHSVKLLFTSQFIQLLIIPIAFTLTGFVGIAVTSAGEVLYGQILWDPLRMIDRWDNRAAAFFASFAFVLVSECPVVAVELIGRWIV